MRQYIVLGLASLGFAYFAANLVLACNEALCASDVSKCLLTKSCGCKPQLSNCSCCSNCTRCLGELYIDCCDCVGLCKKNHTHGNYRTKSSVEDILDSIPSLFDALTEDGYVDDRLKWSVMRLSLQDELYKPPVEGHSSLTFNGEKKTAYTPKLKLHHQSLNESMEMVEENPQDACTVAYFDECMSFNKCGQACQSVGASRYRWFHNTCCECVGHTCAGYGKNEPKCRECDY